jgi:hypothetical protein
MKVLLGRRIQLLMALAFGIMQGSGCDVLNGDDGPSSICLYHYAVSSTPSDFGQGCASNDDCAHGVCVQPGDSGNITNEVFGFCSRGCDCDDSDDAQITDAQTYSCVYPGGCFEGESKGAWRHAVAKCSTLEDCKSIDDRYTDCDDTSSLFGCGQLHTVCIAR